MKMLYNRLSIYKFGNNTYPRRIRRRSNLGHILREKSASYGPGNTVIILSVTESDKVQLVSSRYSDSLQAGRSGDRIPVGARCSANVRTGPGAHPASYTVGTVPFPGVKRQGRGVDHPPLSSAEVNERVELYLYSPSGSSWPVQG